MCAVVPDCARGRTILPGWAKWSGGGQKVGFPPWGAGPAICGFEEDAVLRGLGFVFYTADDFAGFAADGDHHLGPEFMFEFHSTSFSKKPPGAAAGGEFQQGGYAA